MTGTKTGWAYAGMLTSCLLWSLSFIWYKQVLAELGVVSIILSRTIIASAFIVAFALLTGRMQRIAKGDRKWFFLMALFQPFAYFICEINGLKSVSPTLASLIISIIPLFTPVCAHFILKDRVRPRFLKGIVISLVGVAVVIFARKGTDMTGTMTGVALMFLAMLSAVAYNLIITRIVHRYNTFTLIAYQNMIGGLLLLPLFFAFERQSFADALPLSGGAVVNLLLLGLLCSGVAYIFFANSIKRIGMTVTMMLENLMPAMTAVASYFILGERLNWLKITGISITIAGLMFGTLGFNPRKWGKKV